jgi:outer membrane protein OmpA-like peptidoglycan-associated protein
MFDRPFRSLSLLAAVCILVVVGSSAQTAPPISRADVFMGYSYFGAHGMVKPADLPYTSINLGAIGSVAYYFSKYAGAQVEFAAHPDGNNDGLYTIQAGPIFRLPMDHVTLFAHGLLGGADLAGPNARVCCTPPAFDEHEPYTWGPSITVGGGMDMDLPWWNHKLGLRLFQGDFEYIHEDYGPPTTIPTTGVLGGRTNLKGARLSTGLVLHFGNIVPPPPVTYACSATPATVYPGDPVTITGTAGALNPKKTATYTWTSDTVKVSGMSSTGTVDTGSLSAGTYTVKGHVSEGPKPGEMADCGASFTVKAFDPPTISCSADPSTVKPGDSSTITASGMSPQNRPLTYSYSASAGSISGTTTTATLSTAGAAPGAIGVTCNVVDDKGQTASAQTTVTVVAPPAPPPPLPVSSSLCSIHFERDKARPVRVDNEAKACLDDVSLNLQRQSDSKLVLVGSSAPSEKKAGSKLAAERALNTKEYLVKEKGVDPSRISTYTTTTTEGKTVTTTLVPLGATFDTSGDTAVSEPVKPMPKKKK